MFTGPNIERCGLGGDASTIDEERSGAGGGPRSVGGGSLWGGDNDRPSGADGLSTADGGRRVVGEAGRDGTESIGGAGEVLRDLGSETSERRSNMDPNVGLRRIGGEIDRGRGEVETRGSEKLRRRTGGPEPEIGTARVGPLDELLLESSRLRRPRSLATL